MQKATTARTQSQQCSERRYAESDFGRVYGWRVRFRGVVVAELNYRRWDSVSQFWHEYYVVPISNRFSELGLLPDRWCQPDVSIESRYCLGYHQNGVLMAPRSDEIVAIRSLLVPREIFEAVDSVLLNEDGRTK